MNKLKLALLSMTMMLVPVFSVAGVSAQDLCSDSQYAANNTSFCQNQTNSNNNPIIDGINTAINILTLLIGTAAVIMTIVGGFKFVTSAGDPQATSAARNTIIYSLVGLVVTILARFIVVFVLGLVS